jgi:AraC-like DNA-binding protein
MCEIADYCKKAILDRIAAIENGDYRLRIPRPRETGRAANDMYVHLTPEFFIQISGATQMRFPHETMRLVAGDICLVPGGTGHAERAFQQNGPFASIVEMFHARSHSIHTGVVGPEGKPISDKLIRFNSPLTAQSRAQLDEMVRIHRSTSTSRESALKGLTLAHLSLLVELLEGEQATHRNENIRVAHCRRIILVRLSDPALSVRALAKELGVTADYLSHLFHQETGIHLAHHINQQRIDTARVYLRDGSLNVSEVAWSCGYRDAGYFARVFRRETGLSPREFRTELTLNS